jgi:hypothetical protein
MAKKRPRGERSKCKQIGGTFVKPATYTLAVELAEVYSVGVGFDRMAKLAKVALAMQRKPLPNHTKDLTERINGVL